MLNISSTYLLKLMMISQSCRIETRQMRPVCLSVRHFIGYSSTLLTKRVCNTFENKRWHRRQPRDVINVQRVKTCALERIEANLGKYKIDNYINMLSHALREGKFELHLYSASKIRKYLRNLFNARQSTVPNRTCVL